MEQFRKETYDWILIRSSVRGHEDVRGLRFGALEGASTVVDLEGDDVKLVKDSIYLIN